MKEENIDEAVREALREEFGDDFSEEKIEGLKQKVRDRLEKKEAKEAAREEMDGGISRRKFLKLAGLGAGGLGLSSMGAASFVDITSGGSSSMTLSDVMSNGNDVGGLDIVDSGTTVYDSSNSWVPASSVEQGGGSGLDADSVDSHDISSGSLANRPSAGVSGRLYVTTDGNGVFYDDGSSWSQVSGKVNDPPTASFTYSPSNPSINESISFDGSGSSDDGYIYKYEWDWTDDGNYEATGETASHSYSSTGDYTVVLRVEDAEGKSSTTSKTISIKTEIVDDFEDGDLSEYGFNEGGDFSIVNSPTYEGNHAVARTGTTAPQSGPEAFSTSGLPAYPQRGDTFRFRWLFQDGNCNSGFWFAVQSETEIPGSYRVTVDNKADLFGFRKYDTSGNESLRDEVAQTYSTSEWYYIKVYWKSDSANAPGSGNNIVAVLYDSNNNKLNQHGISDSTYDSGGIGFNDWGPIEAPTITIDKIEIL